MKKYIAEFVGTFVLVFIGCGTAAISGGINGVLGVMGIAMAFGLSIVAMAYSIGNVSGCHINPAVSLAMLCLKKMNVKDFVCYVIAQVAGAIVAAIALKAVGSMCMPEITALGTNGFGALSYVKLNINGALLVETILTAVFVLAILGVTSKAENGAIAGLVIGSSLTLVHLIGIPLTGTSVNPARSVGPAIVAGGEALSQVWVFVAAPLIGALVAVAIWKAIKD